MTSLGINATQASREHFPASLADAVLCLSVILVVPLLETDAAFGCVEDLSTRQV